MADMNPYIYALGTGVGGALAFVGKWVISIFTKVLDRAEARGDRLETKLLDTQALVYPALEAANTAIRESINAIKKEG